MTEQTTVETAEQSNPQIEEQASTSIEDAIGSIVDDLYGEPKASPEKEPAAEPVKAEEGQKQPDVAPQKVKVGDEELTIDELIAGNMKERDYRQKTQALAEERRKIAAYEAHIRAMESDPKYFEHVRSYRPAQPEAAKPDDPIEAIKWEAKEQAKRELMQELSPHIQGLQARQELESVRAHISRDPLFEETQAAILNMVNSLPPTVKELTYQKLDRDPNAYLETYQDARKWVMGQKEAADKAKAQPSDNAKEGDPQAVQRRERAPLLESKGRVPTGSEEKSKEKALADLNRKIKSGRISNEDAMDFFELSGIAAKLA